MGRVQDTLFATDAVAGTAAQALNLGGYIATNGFRQPLAVINEGYQLANNGVQLYGMFANNGGVNGLADNPELYTGRALFQNTVTGLTSGYDLLTAPGRLGQVREANEEDPNRLRRGLRYVTWGAGVLSDLLNVAEAGSRVSRRFGADF
jgi:hypothetical protein